ncbi:MAG TPA: YqiA/YcfP family alpha/beta fold hydrolase [Rhodanobacteraceae bacterium]
MPGHIILSHGANSSPQATKVSALAQVAEEAGWTTERPDFAACDARGLAQSVAPRVKQVVDRMHAARTPVVLVGSSMGAFASGLASLRASCAGLFLMALPTAIPGFDEAFDMARDVPTLLIHGYADEICDPSATLALARTRGVPCLMVDDGHRLAGHLDAVIGQFRLFLQQVAA